MKKNELIRSKGEKKDVIELKMNMEKCVVLVSYLNNFIMLVSVKLKAREIRKLHGSLKEYHEVSLWISLLQASLCIQSTAELSRIVGMAGTVSAESQTRGMLV